LVSGIETECRVGLLVAPGHYEAGWHSTATIGTFGAAAACAHALGLDQTRWLNTFGLAGMQAQGLKSMFGTMAKPFQVGRAASNGLLSALMAERGYTSNRQVLECDQGFSKTQSGTFNDTMPDGYQILKTRFKKYACCGGTHPTIEAARSLTRDYGVRPEQIAHARIQVHPSRDKACNIQDPRSPLEGKFSLRFVAALALLGSDLDNQAFSSENLRSPAVVGLIGRTSVNLSVELGETASIVSLDLTDGQRIQASAQEGDPEADKQREWDDLVRKFGRLVNPILGTYHTSQLIERIAAIEETKNLQEVTALCVT
jgi:2-methylcitrate dehydratase PrpD